MYHNEMLLKREILFKYEVVIYIFVNKPFIGIKILQRHGYITA